MRNQRFPWTLYYAPCLPPLRAAVNPHVIHSPDDLISSTHTQTRKYHGEQQAVPPFITQGLMLLYISYLTKLNPSTAPPSPPPHCSADCYYPNEPTSLGPEIMDGLLCTINNKCTFYSSVNSHHCHQNKTFPFQQQGGLLTHINFPYSICCFTNNFKMSFQSQSK